MEAIIQIAKAVYMPIMAATAVGFIISKLLSRQHILIKGIRLEDSVPEFLSRFLYLVGIPIGVANFIRKADLNASSWLAPLVAWAAVFLGIFLSTQILRSSKKHRSRQTRRSYIILSYLGNTSYLGFPVILLLPQLGAQYFSSAVLYDILGTLPAAYGLGALIAQSNLHKKVASSSEFPGLTGMPSQATDANDIPEKPVSPFRDAIQEILKNPTLYAFFVGLYLKSFQFPELLAEVLNAIAWGSIMVALLVMGMRAQQLTLKGELGLAIQPVVIKTILTPLIIGTALTMFGLDGPQRLVLVLQTSMPCAFAALVLSENYDLDTRVTVASIFLSCIVFVLMLPIWTWAFTTW